MKADNEYLHNKHMGFYMSIISKEFQGLSKGFLFCSALSLITDAFSFSVEIYKKTPHSTL